MTDVTTLLDQALNPTLAAKKEEVSAASLDKTLDYRSIATARATGKGSKGLTGVRWDLQNLTPSQLELKYGADGVRFMQNIASGAMRNIHAGRVVDNRNLLEAGWDTGTGVVAGAAGGLAGLGALGIGVIDAEAGARAGQKVQQGMEWVEGIQSDGVNAARQLQRTESALDKQDNTAQYEEEIRADPNDLLAGMRRWGRDTVDTVANSTDPTMFIQGTAEAAGSLLAGGPLAKGLKVIGKTALATAGARLSPKTAIGLGAIGETIRWPAAIAGLEGGGAFSGTTSEVMNMSFDDLRKNSPDFAALEAQVGPEAARAQIANDAGMRSAAVSASVAALTAGLSRWAENPLARRSVGQTVGNVRNEVIEETTQGTAGQLAQNEAIQKYADRNRNLSEGVGEQTALGALYGAGSSVGVQAGGAGVNAAKSTVQLGRAIHETFKGKGFANVIADAYNKQVDEAEKSSPVSEDILRAASAEARTVVAPLVENLRNVIDVSEADEPTRTAEHAFVDQLGPALELTPEEVATLPPSMQAVVSGSEDRLSAVQDLAKHARTLEKGSPEALEAFAAYQALLEPMEGIQQPDLQILSDMQQYPEIETQFNQVRKLIAQANNTANTKRMQAAAVQAAEQNPVQPEQVSDAAIATPEGQAAAKGAAALASLVPGTGKLATLTQVLKHATNGLINLTRPQRNAVSATIALLKGEETRIEKMEKSKGKLSLADIVNKQVLSDTSDPLSKGGRFKLSARQHVNNILSAVKSNNVKEASALLEDFGLFAQHMQNKLQAHNEHYGLGNPNAPKIGFEALSPDTDRVWYKSKPFVFVNTKSRSSIEHAQTVAAEAEIVTQIYNDLADALPELGQKRITLNDLDPALQGDIDEVFAFHKKQPMTLKAEPAAVEEKPVASIPVETKEVVTQKEPIVEDKKELTSEEMMATRVDWQGQIVFTGYFNGMKPGDLKIDAVDGNPTMKVLSYITPQGLRVSGTYDLEKNGTVINDLTITSEAGPQKLGVASLRTLFDKMLVEHPGVTRLTGTRQTGIRGQTVALEFDVKDGRVVVPKKAAVAALSDEDLKKRLDAAMEQPGYQDNPTFVALNEEMESRETAAAEALAQQKAEEESVEVVEEEPAVEEAPKTAREYINKEWMKGDIQELRPTNGRARITVGNTTISYDRIGKRIVVNLVRTPKEFRTVGSGRKAMNAFLKMTDEAGLSVDLTVAEQDQNTDREKLIKFYNSLGFTMGEGDEMSRAVGAGPVEYQPQVSADDLLGSDDWSVTSSGSSGPLSLNEGQKQAAAEVEAFLKSKDRTWSIIGSAGTGKTTLINSILSGLKGFDVILTSPTHRANSVIRAKNPSKKILTLHKLLGLKPSQDLEDFDAKKLEFAPGEDGNIPANSLIVVDESSMINDALFKYIGQKLEESPGSKLIFMGDSAQLGPVKQSTDSKALTSTSGQSVLTEVMRAKNVEMLNESVAVREEGNFTNEINLKGNNGVGFFNNADDFLNKIRSAFTSPEFKKNPLLARVVAGTNKAVDAYNAAVRSAIYGDKAAPYVEGEILMGYASSGSADMDGDTPIANGVDYIVEKVADARNATYAGVSMKVYPIRLRNILTGKTKQVEIISPDNSTAKFGEFAAALDKLIEDAKKNRSLWKNYYELKERVVTPQNIMNPNRANNTLLSKTIDYGYAHTIHKSQGGTYTYAFVDGNSINNFPSQKDRERLRYVGLTRAESGAFVLTGEEITIGSTGQVVKEEPAPMEGVPDAQATVGPAEAKDMTDSTLNKKVDTLEAKKAPTEVQEATLNILSDEVQTRAELDAAEVPEGSEPAVVIETQTDDNKAREAMAERYPDLAYRGDYSLLSAMQLVPDSTRIAEQEQPALFVMDALENQKSLELFVPDVKHELTRDVANGYATLFDVAIPNIVHVMRENLKDFLAKNGNLKKFQEGIDINRWVNGKAANILNAFGVYNENLLQAAGMAGMQWALGARQVRNDNTDEDYATMTGTTDPSLIPEHLRLRLDAGMDVKEVKFAIADKIAAYWGLRSRTDADKAYAEGIPEAVAAEVMTAMEESGVLVIDRIQLGAEHGLPTPRTFNRYSVNKDSYPETLEAYPTAIDDVVLVNPEPLRFIDGDLPPVAQNQMNNPSVQNTADQKKTLEIAGKTPHNVSMPMLHAVLAMGEDAFIRMLGGRDPKWTKIDPLHEKTLAGRELNIKNAYRELQATIAEMTNRANKAGKPLSDIEIRYAYNMSKVGRMQMLGGYNSQSNKFTREVILPTFSTLDLMENDAHKQAFFLAIAQHLDDTKINKMSIEASVAITREALEGKYAPVVQYLRDWVKTIDLNAVPKKGDSELSMDEIQKLLGDKKLSMAGLHSLVEYARFMESDEAGKKAFRTGLYLEADGVTNGPIMAMMMLTIGQFNKNWLNNIRKGGVSFGIKRAVFEMLLQDLYETATINMVGFRQKLLTKVDGQKDREKIMKNIDALTTVMGSLFGSDVSFDPDTGELTFKRGIAKNPLTITLYGSAPTGIAGNFASKLLDALNERRTIIASSDQTPAELFFNGDEAANKKYEEAFHTLTTSVLGFDLEKNRYYVTDSKWRSDYQALQDNFLYGFVEPMVEGIEETVGAPLMKSVRLLRQATQVQSIFLEKAYSEAITAKIAERKAADPTRKNNDFLSREDFAEIDKAMAKRFPNIKTSSQVFRVAKSKQNFDENVKYSRGFDEGHPTGARTYVPVNAGVSGIASLVIGFGDGYMVQVAVQDPAMTGILAVFDGINMPLNQLESHGTAANKAAYEAFMQNPMRAVDRAYSEFLKQLGPVSGLDQKMLNDLAWAFQKEGQAALKAEEIAPVLDNMMKELGRNITWASKSIEARHKAEQDVAMFIDHMAASGNDYTNGVPVVEMTDDQLLAFLNQRYDHYMGVVSDTVPMTLVAADTDIDVQLYRSEYFPILATELELTEDQQVTMKEVLNSLSVKGYKLVTGTKEGITAYRLRNGLSVDVISENTNGFISPAEQTIYLIDANAETLTHELVHAATYEKLLAHYAGNTDTAVSEAVQELELMMEDFLSMPVDANMPFEQQLAMEEAKAAINEWTNNKNVDSVVSKASALNEFMAWSLSNQALMDKLKQTPVPLFIKWAKGVVNFVKQMFSGKNTSAGDFLSNIQFNTGIVMRAQNTLAQGFEEVTLHHAGTTRPALLAVRNRLRDAIATQVRQVDAVDQRQAATKLAQYLVEAEELANGAAAAFRLSEVEKSTLAAVVAAMGTEMQLNPDVLARMQTLYAHVQKNLKTDAFRDLTAEDQDADKHWANEKLKYVLGRNDRRTDPQGLTSLLPMFIGLTMVSEEMNKALMGMSVPGSSKKDGTFDEKVRQYGDDVMNMLSTRMAGDAGTTNVSAAMQALSFRLYNNLNNERSSLDEVEQTIDNKSLGLNAWMRNLLIAASDKGFEYGQAKKATAITKLQRSVANALIITSGLASEKNGEKVAEGVLKTSERVGMNNAFLNIMKDFIGRTEATADVYDLIKPIRTAVQQIRQQFRDSVPKIITDAFTRAPTKEQYASMFRGMAKTDVAALLGSMSKADVLKLYSDDAFLANTVTDLETQLRGMDPRHFSVLKAKAKQLAKYMNTGVVGSNLLRNAYAVSRLWNENVSTNRRAVTTEMQDAVDQLISLYAIEGLSTNDRTTMASLVRDEVKGMDFTLSYLQGQRKTEIAKAKLGKALPNHYKGYINSLPQKAGNVVIADDSEYTTMIQRGYVRVKDYRGSNILNIGQSRGYYYTDVPTRASFAQGLMQNVDQTAYGVDPATGFSHEVTAGRIVNRRLVAQLTAAMARETSTTENLMPIYNDRGVVIAFEQSYDPAELNRLGRSEQLHDMLGVWRGRQVEERFSVQKNKVLIDALHKNWEENKNHDPDLYVNLMAPGTLDAVERDAVSLFSDEAKAYITEKFGKGKFMVRRSLLEDVTGYRNASSSDFWTGINRLKPETNEAIRRVLISTFGNDIYKKMVNAEGMIQGLMSDIRTQIVVKSAVVPFVNMVSNVLALMARGVNPIQIAKQTPSVVSQLHGYLESRLEQINLEAQLRATPAGTQREARLRAKIRSITDSHQRLSIWPLIEAGEFSSIADVGLSRDDLELSSGRFHEWLDNHINKLPPDLRTAAKYGMVSKDTALFHGLQKSVQYGDFIAKAILFDHLMKKENHTREQALARITEEYVNYDRLPGRTRGGLENMGLLWFYNFKLRSVKVALSTLRNNPLHALMVSIIPVPSGVGTAVDENFVAKGLEGSLGWSVGPGMALRAPLLNPWFNLVN